MCSDFLLRGGSLQLAFWCREVGFHVFADLLCPSLPLIYVIPCLLLPARYLQQRLCFCRGVEGFRLFAVVLLENPAPSRGPQCFRGSGVLLPPFHRPPTTRAASDVSETRTIPVQRRQRAGDVLARCLSTGLCPRGTA